MKNQSKNTNIYIGLNDRLTGVQKYSTDKYLAILKNVCRSYHVAFSVHLINGGFFHEDGRYVEENTLSLMMYDVSEETIMEIAKDLCVFFNQESVLVSSSESKVFFVKENL